MSAVKIFKRAERCTRMDHYNYMVPRGNGGGGGGSGRWRRVRYSSSELSSESAEKRAIKASFAASLAGVSYR